MTNEKKTPRGQYKQLFYWDNPQAHYTSSMMPYDDYRQTDIWKALRNRRLQKDFFRCCYCGSGINVAVHHLRYPDVWGTESVDDDLITLCESCHAEVHKMDNANKENAQ